MGVPYFKGNHDILDEPLELDELKELP